MSFNRSQGSGMGHMGHGNGGSDMMEQVLEEMLAKIREKKASSLHPDDSMMNEVEGSPEEEAHESPEMEAKEDKLGMGDEEISPLQKYMKDSKKNSSLGKKKGIMMSISKVGFGKMK